MPEFCGAVVETSRFAENLDRAAEEVLGTMMGVGCDPVEELREARGETISAVIGLAGTMSGSMVLHSGFRAARRMTELMTGVAPEEIDGMVRDAVGEVCNMLAGAWKGRDASLCAGCLLSTPTVVAGSRYELFSERAPVRIERSYRFEDMTFTVTLFCELRA